MSQFHRVTPDFAVAGQISVEDMARAKAEGFTTIIVNRPDHEDPDQPTEAQMRAAAQTSGLGFISLPFQGPPPPAIVARTAEALEAARGPVLAYCRTGRRSIMAWALAQALAGARRPDELVALAAKAGYDLGGARGALETLSPKP